LSNGKAILGKPGKQFYTFRYPWDTATPYFAYFDKNFTCDNCRKPFVFSKEEQQHWYEKLKFVVYSVPKECKECRRPRKLNRELSELLRDGKPDDVAALLRIAEIYAEMDKPEKQKAYLAEARKRTARR
jgi:hypothetical protein